MGSMTELVQQTSAAVAALDAPDTDLGSTIGADYLALRGLVEKLEVVGLRLLAAFDATGMASADGSASTTAWVRRHTGCAGRAASADVRLARRLHTDQARPLTTTAALLDDGQLTVGHARVIARATAMMGPEAFEAAEPVVAKASVELPVDAAGQVATQVCQHADELYAGGQDDPAEARRAAAEAGRHLNLSPCGDMYALEAMLSAEAGQALQAVLEPLAVPRPDADWVPDWRTATQRRADAMGEAAAMLLASDTLPTYGGQRPQVTVLVDLDTLLSDAAAGSSGGWFPDGGGLSRAATERMGCDARVSWIATRHGEVYPDGSDDATVAADDAHSAVGPILDRDLVREALRRVSPALGGLPADVLDAGRAQRLVSPGQRRALAVRDRGCVFPGCDRPPGWCDAHHLQFWSRGGCSDLPNLVLLCSRHHIFVHDQGWQLTRAPDGTVTAHPPP